MNTFLATLLSINENKVIQKTRKIRFFFLVIALLYIEKRLPISIRQPFFVNIDLKQIDTFIMYQNFWLKNKL